MVQKVYDELAYGMEKVLADESYQQIFAKPKIKTASVKVQPEQVKLSTNGITDTFNTLVTLSGMLDEMGLSRSSAQLLKAAQGISDEVRVDELEPGDDGVPEWLHGAGDTDEPSGDHELDDLLRELGQGSEGTGSAWDVGSVMDKPDEKDHDEGDPE